MGGGTQSFLSHFSGRAPGSGFLEGRRLAEIVVGSGPGSYGGIRVALAVADGLSLVHGSRVAAFSSWNGLGIHAPLACVMSDARRGGWAWARVTAGVLEGALEVLPGEQAAARVGMPGDRSSVYSTGAAGTWPPGAWRASCPFCRTRKRWVPLGWLWTRCVGEELLAAPAEPLMSGSHITSSNAPPGP